MTPFRPGFLASALALGLSGCAALPVSLHNPTANGGFAEAGAIYSPSESLDSVKGSGSKAAEKLTTLDTRKNRSGIASLFQSGPFYAKFDAAPLPGAWVGIGSVNPRPGRFGWYPALEFSGAGGNSKSKASETTDGYLTDSDGNRYLYEKKTERGGLSLASPQILEVYPVSRLALYGAAIPTFIYGSEETTIEMVYDRDDRLVQADPALKARFDRLQKDEGGLRHYSRASLPLTVGVRLQLRAFHARAAYEDRSIDSRKDFSATFRRLYLVEFGYQFAASARAVEPERRAEPAPPPAPPKKPEPPPPPPPTPKKPEPKRAPPPKPNDRQL